MNWIGIPLPCELPSRWISVCLLTREKIASWIPSAKKGDTFVHILTGNLQAGDGDGVSAAEVEDGVGAAGSGAAYSADVAQHAGRALARPHCSQAIHDRWDTSAIFSRQICAKSAEGHGAHFCAQCQTTSVWKLNKAHKKWTTIETHTKKTHWGAKWRTLNVLSSHFRCAQHGQFLGQLNESFLSPQKS